MDQLTGRRICELVAGVIATDGELHSKELGFLLKMFDRFGVAQSGDDEMMRPTAGPDEAAKQILELPQELREEALSLVIDATMADGKIVAAERAYVAALGRAAGYDQAEIERRLDERAREMGIDE